MRRLKLCLVIGILTSKATLNHFIDWTNKIFKDIQINQGKQFILNYI